MTAPANDPAPKNWKVFVAAPRRRAASQDIDLFKDFAVSVEKREALDHLRVYDFKTGAWTTIAFPGAGVLGLPGRHAGLRIARPTATTTRASSRLRAFSITTCAPANRTLLKQQEVLGGYDPTQYASERLWATARDGVKVPISIVYKKGFARDGKAPLFLYGYGSLRLRHAGHVFQQPAEPARPRHGLRHRAHPRRRRDGRDSGAKTAC